ncbi:MAG: flagellar basal body rod protein FlgB [Alphaproteobacteria bacterium]|nr:flagellar basal body rod protein FlgB [Alphaproteobacteria bacterium]
MSLQSSTLFSMLHERIDWLSQRQQVLSQNVANANTAGYVAKDLKPLDFRLTLRNQSSHVVLDRTDTSHRFGRGDSNPYREMKIRTPYEVSLSGNTVTLEQQMAKVAANQADYQLASRIFTKYTKMHAIVLGGKF